MNLVVILFFFFIQQTVSIGPDSVAFRFTSDALCFGGQQCTLTDIAMAAGIAPPNIGQGPDAVKSITASVVYSAMREIRRRLEMAIDSMKVITSAHHILVAMLSAYTYISPSKCA